MVRGPWLAGKNTETNFSFSCVSLLCPLLAILCVHRKQSYRAMCLYVSQSAPDYVFLFPRIARSAYQYFYARKIPREIERGVHRVGLFYRESERSVTTSQWPPYTCLSAIRWLTFGTCSFFPLSHSLSLTRRADVVTRTRLNRELSSFETVTSSHFRVRLSWISDAIEFFDSDRGNITKRSVHMSRYFGPRLLDPVD